MSSRHYSISSSEPVTAQQNRLFPGLLLSTGQMLGKFVKAHLLILLVPDLLLP